MSEKLRNITPFLSGSRHNHIWGKGLLLSLAFLFAGPPLYGQFRDVSVIGYSKDGKLAAVRKVVIGEETPEGRGHQYTMDIQTWDLARKKMANTFSVITQKDTNLIRAGMKDKEGDIAKYPRMRRLRARRWKKVNRSLKSIGFNIVKLPTPIQATGKNENKRFDLENEGLVVWFKVYPKIIKPNENKGIRGSFPKVDLMLGMGGKTVTLRPKFYPEDMRRLGFVAIQDEAMYPRQYIAGLYLSPDKKYLIAINRGVVMVFDLKAQLRKLAAQ